MKWAATSGKQYVYSGNGMHYHISMPCTVHSSIPGTCRYILVYPQGCDVCNHLSLFLCVADYDKLLPGKKAALDFCQPVLLLTWLTWSGFIHSPAMQAGAILRSLQLLWSTRTQRSPNIQVCTIMCLALDACMHKAVTQGAPAMPDFRMRILLQLQDVSHAATHFMMILALLS